MKAHRRAKPEGVRLLRIGSDLDGVVQDFHLNWTSYMVHAGHFDPARVDTSDQVAWSMAEHYGITSEEFDAYFEEGVEAGYIFCQGDPLPGSLETLNKLFWAGHSIHFLTARTIGTKFAHNTLDWLHEKGFMYDGITFSYDKTVMDLDIVIDDHERNYKQLTAAGKNAVLLDQPWNRHLVHAQRSSWAGMSDYLVEKFGIQPLGE